MSGNGCRCGVHQPYKGQLHLRAASGGPRTAKNLALGSKYHTTSVASDWISLPDVLRTYFLYWLFEELTLAKFVLRNVIFLLLSREKVSNDLEYIESHLNNKERHDV